MPKITPPNPRNLVRQFRQSKGWTQQELAEKAQIHVSTVERIESAKFSGLVKRDVQKLIAEALGETSEVVFPQTGRDIQTTSRRRLFEKAGIVGLGLTLGALDTTSVEDPFDIHQNRSQLSNNEIQTLIQDNHATWAQFNTLHLDISLELALAISEGKLVTYSRLSKGSLPSQQKEMMLLLLGDMHLLVGRIAREMHNFGESERHFQQAMRIGRDINNPDLKTAAREYYGYLLTDQELFTAAKKNGKAILEEAKTASFPVWAEAQLTAAYAFAYTGEYAQAQRIAYEARKASKRPASELRIGSLTNPDVVHSQFDIQSRLAAQHYYEAAKAAEEGITNLEREQPDNTQFRARLQIYQATALWGLGDVDGTVTVLTQSLNSTHQIGSVLNTTRIEKLYQKMRLSQFARHPKIRDLGELI